MGVPPRQRDLFPLPFIVGENSYAKRCSPSLCSRTGDAEPLGHLAASWANDGIRVLNTLAGRGSAARGPTPAASQATSASKGEYYAHCAPPDGMVGTDEEILSRLLAKSGAYSDERADVARYRKELVSWPDPGTSPVKTIDVLPKADQRLLGEWESHLVRDADSAHTRRVATGVQRPHCDPGLFANKGRYAKFLRGLISRHLLKWRVAGGRRGEFGIFFVREKMAPFVSSSTPGC